MSKTKVKEYDLNFIATLSDILPEKQYRNLFNPNTWWQNFAENITYKIDPSIFDILYNDTQGAPRCDSRTLVAMLIIKESKNFSYRELDDNFAYDLRLRIAIGQPTFDSAAPTSRTLQDFIKKVVDYEKETGINLIEKAREELTKKQLQTLNIDGQEIRLDSKLIGSNLAHCSRYQIVYGVLMKELSNAPELESNIGESTQELLKKLRERDPKKETYELKPSEIKGRLSELGKILLEILTVNNLLESEHPLSKVFKDQYNYIGSKISVDDHNGDDHNNDDSNNDHENGNGSSIEQPEEEQVEVKNSKDIEGTSIQSPHDYDSHYRRKGDQRVTGFSVNVTETVSTENQPAIILDVDVRSADAADCDFLQDGVTKAEEVLGQKVTRVYADGAYQSEENREFVSDKEITFVTSGLVGTASKYDLEKNEDGTLKVTDTETTKTYIAEQVKSRTAEASPKWKAKIILNGEPKILYFTEKQVEICEERKKQKNFSKEEKAKRNNVEASMYMINRNNHNGKTKYRGLIKNRIIINAKVMWINFIRGIKFNPAMA